MQNRDAAVLAGISVETMQTLAIVLGCLATGLAGQLYARTAYLYPAGGVEATLIALVITLFAGVGRIRSILIGAWLFALIETTVSYLWGAKWHELLSSIFLIAILVWHPEGILQRRTRTS